MTYRKKLIEAALPLEAAICSLSQLRVKPLVVIL